MMQECDVDPEDDVIHFDSSQYHQSSEQFNNNDNDQLNHSANFPGERRQSRKKSGTFSNTWSKVRQSFTLSGKHHHSSSSNIYRESQVNNKSSTGSAGRIKASRSSNNISDMVSHPEDEYINERDSFRDTRQRGVSVSSKQEASLLLTLQNSPSSSRRRSPVGGNGSGTTTPPPPMLSIDTSTPPPPSSSSSVSRAASRASIQQNTPRASTANNNQRTPSHRDSTSNPSSQTRRKSQKQSSDGCLPS
jgi:hypothetical protein